jgi:hypothetical protein
MAVIILAIVLTIITGSYYFGRDLSRPAWLVLFIRTLLKANTHEDGRSSKDLQVATLLQRKTSAAWHRAANGPDTDHGESSYQGTERLKDRHAIVTRAGIR